MNQQLSMFDLPQFKVSKQHRYQLITFIHYDGEVDEKQEFPTVKAAQRAILKYYADYDAWAIWDHWTQAVVEAYGDWRYDAKIGGSYVGEMTAPVWEVPWMLRNREFMKYHPKPKRVTWTIHTKAAAMVP